MTSLLDIRGAPAISLERVSSWAKTAVLAVIQVGHRGYQEETSFLSIIPQPQRRTKLMRELF